MTAEPNLYRELFYTQLSHNDKYVLEALATEELTSRDIARFIETEDLSRARVFVSKLRRKLAGTAYSITSNVGGAHALAVYKLERGE